MVYDYFMIQDTSSFSKTIGSFGINKTPKTKTFRIAGGEFGRIKFDYAIHLLKIHS